MQSFWLQFLCIGTRKLDMRKLSRFGIISVFCPSYFCRGCFDVGEDDEGATSPSWKRTAHLDTDQFLSKGSLGAIDQESGRNEGENSGRSSSLPRHVILEHKKFLSGSLIPDNAFSSKKAVGEADR